MGNKKTLPFTTPSKKYLGNKFNQGCKRFVLKKVYDTEESEDDINNWKHIHVQTERINIFKMCILTQSNLKIQHNSCQDINGLFHRTRTKNLKIYMEQQETSTSHSNLEKQGHSNQTS